ncbi:nucleoside phosphorylase domain-containing protein [Chaetomium fimeti]|uniref:Nucleoside phosphorylase domain-containing protein n=1 Tax=Chaetomium fimeti TaxID=1854472 RepID=A0AAE0H8B0_9PEZI|nr:nucleoside phosphorylase domain-containing protein [Chaetomium fimeti]
MPERNDYTVGWVSALPIERAAAHVVLDKVHDRLDYNPHRRDSNTYLLGEIGDHNVVICILPKGEYGISTATAAATNMLNTFPSIRFGLMVGIGGGAPSRENDIRLGDIVVSRQDGNGTGVFQFDYGTTIQGQEFLTTGYLNPPPQILEAAVADMEAEHLVNGHSVDDDITGIIKGKPQLERLFRRPGQDLLFKSHVVHPTKDDVNCAEHCAADKSNLVDRRLRAQDESSPAIHYGLIASSNQLMKDALVRDRFSKEKGVLCFEMEAAGLMNIFDCLVIRGICDYSDSHKNKVWQPYAALAAAVYAKDLLLRVSPLGVEAQDGFIDRFLAGQWLSVEAVTKRWREMNANNYCSICSLQSAMTALWSKRPPRPKPTMKPTANS